MESDKSWSIKFNIELDTEMLDKNISITDSKGNVFETIMNISNDGKIVNLIPKKAYSSDETYTLNVNRDVKPVKGKNLRENSTKKFTVSIYIQWISIYAVLSTQLCIMINFV